MNKTAENALIKLMGTRLAREHVSLMDESQLIRLGGLVNRGTNPFRPDAPPNPPKPYTAVELWTCNNCGAKSQENAVCDFCGGHEKL